MKKQIKYLTQNTCNMFFFFLVGVFELQGIQLLDFVFLRFWET